MEEKIRFLSEGYEIEGRIEKNSQEKGIVITHPHPLYGGSLNNPVVETITSSHQKNGYTTLRFNFRGVGNSQGNYDNGIGEQQDIRGALTYLTNIGVKEVDLAGYSFGAWVNVLLISSATTAENMIMVSPPVEFIDFGTIAAIDCLKLVVTGSRDEIAPAHLIHKLLPTWNPDAQFEILEGSDHFYSGYLDKLESILSAFLQESGQ